LTEEHFTKVKFVNSHWLEKVIEEGDWQNVDVNEHDLGHVFRMFTQNNPEIYAKPQTAKEKLSVEKQQ